MDKILVVGCGGREYSIIKALHKDKEKNNLEIYCIGDFVNYGIHKLVNAYCSNTQRIVEFVEDYNINMTIIGPEAFLEKGVVNTLSRKWCFLYRSY